MALENRTISEINKLIIDQLEAQFNKIIPLLPKAFIRILAKVLAAVSIILYKIAGWIFLQIFVSTASFEEVTIYGQKLTPLIEWGRLKGIGDPTAAVQAEYDLDITVNSLGSTLPSGTQFLSTLNNVIYITQQSYLLSNPTETIQVIATMGGTVGNLSVSDILSTVNTLGIIDNDGTISAVLTTGVDAETEASYRQRVVEAFQLQPQGGAYADYRLWASDVPGVLQTYIYTGDTPANVIVYVAGDSAIYPDRIPDTALLEAVGNAIDFDPDTTLSTRRPITAIIDPAGDGSYGNVLPVIIKPFDVDVTGVIVDDLATVKTEIKAALNIYFLGREPYIIGLSLPPALNTISQSNIIGIVNDIVQSHNGSFTTAILELDEVTIQNYVAQEGELAKLDVLTVNGAIV